MKRVKLTVAYDGTKYCGWQVQPGVETVEGVLNATISNFLHREVKVIGASRTDSGVHAYGNVAVFDVEDRYRAEIFANALNTFLPPDIVIQSSEEVPLDWHPRHCDCRKTYEYRILNRSHRDPLRKDHTMFYYKKLDVESMKEAAGALVGEHDFKSFCSVKTTVESTIRTIYACDVICEEIPMDPLGGRLITIRITGNGFLYNMVRIIAGTLLQVGTGKIAKESIKSMLEARDREASGPTAPPEGLTLMQIIYER